MENSRLHAKILVLSNYSSNIDELNAFTAPNKKLYCEMHGYEFRNLNLNYDERSHRGFLKILKSLIPKYDAVMTIGCDTLFMNLSIKIQDRMDLSRVMVAREYHSWWPINNDVMIWPNHANSLQLVDKILEDMPIWLKYRYLWQMHLWNLMQTNYGHCINLVDARYMNSSLTLDQGMWQLGDWILHARGMETENKIKSLKEYAFLVGDGTYNYRPPPVIVESGIQAHPTG
jgi:hypothetical protein